MKNHVTHIRELRHPILYVILAELRNPELTEKERWKLLKGINKKTVNVGGIRVI